MKKLLILAVLLAACSPTVAPIDSDESVHTIDGTPVSIDDLVEDSPAIITFWASWCSFCKEELPRFQEIAHAYPELKVVAVNLQEKPDVVAEYWEGARFSFPTLLDPEEKLKKRFDVFTQPTTFFLDAHGVIASLKNGPLTKAELQSRVAEIMGFNTAPIDSVDTVSQISDLPETPDTSPVSPLLQSWYGEEVVHLIPLTAIVSGGPTKDGIPSIDSPVFTSLEEAGGYLADSDKGLLLSQAGEVRFYPFVILNWHEIVNDTIGSKKIAVTYCPLCDTAVVYDRSTTRGHTEFGVSGLLHESNMLMYDRQTESLWNQATGQAVIGPLTGERLHWVPSDIVQFGTVLESYPDAVVLSRATGVIRDYGRNPYEGYDQHGETVFAVSTTDDRLSTKSRVIGVVVDGQAKAYFRGFVRRQTSFEDTIAGVPVTVSYDNKREHVSVVRTDTGDIVPIFPSFWFSWVAQYPETELKE